MIYKLNVPFRLKDRAKELGAKWNWEEKYWYYDGESLPEGLSLWYGQTDSEESQVCKEGGFAAALASQSDGAETMAGQTGSNYGSNIGESGVTAAYKTVSQVNAMIADTYFTMPSFQRILVKGEVTNYSGANNGNYYFSIKDEHSILPCVMWKSEVATGLKFKLEKGQQVAISGCLDYYSPYGKSQLHALRILNIGEGADNLALEQLRERLRAEGLFDLAHKLPIPQYPERIGIVTSKDGQAIKDICKVAGRRNPYAQLILYPVNVQGKNAVSTIVKGLKKLDAMHLDVIIVGRGGGSDEELKSYNDEAIARAVYEAVTPIVSAVGHEGHWTLIDETADKRAATPSEAAELVCPDVMAELKRVQMLTDEMTKKMERLVEQRKLRLQTKLAVLEKNSPGVRLKEQKERLEYLHTLLLQNMQQAVAYKGFRFDSLVTALRQNMQQVMAYKKYRFETLVARLDGLSPTARLMNGFGYVLASGKPVGSAKDVRKGDEISVLVHDGEITAQVTEVARKHIVKEAEK